MKPITRALAALLVLTLAGYSYAQEEGKRPAKPRPLKGKVVRVEGTNLIVQVMGKPDQAAEQTVQTDEKTIVMIEGKQATLADLVAGQVVIVRPATGVAEKIEVPAPKPKKDGAAGKEKAEGRKNKAEKKGEAKRDEARQKKAKADEGTAQ